MTSPASAQRDLQIQATAEVTRDTQELGGYWNERLKAYFAGPDDPDYTIVVIRPYRIEYMAIDSRVPQVWER